MSISEKNIVELVGMMMRGITTGIMVDPLRAAEIFADYIDDLGGEYAHIKGIGYVMFDDDDVMMVEWQADGVVFDDHHEHPQTLNVIREALRTLTKLEEEMLMPSAEEDSDDMEWV